MVEPMMTARQVAEVLGVHENWVYDQAVGGDLPSYKIGGTRRFDAEELRAWIAAHREDQRETAKRVSPGARPRHGSGTTSAAEISHTPQPEDDQIAADGTEQPRLFEG
jgi:excisionase family DNA binding protein